MLKNQISSLFPLPSSLNTGRLVAALVCALALASAGAARADNPRVTMIVASRGTIVMELYPKDAPKTVAHFLDLVKKHFYDGIKIHRVEPDFVVQMGDPETKNISPDQFEAHRVGMNGSGTSVPLEVKKSNLKDTLGMARTNDPNTGDSQFFINLKDNAFLDSLNGGYTVFGKVVKGMDVVDKLKIGDKITSIRLITVDTKTKPAKGRKKA